MSRLATSVLRLNKAVPPIKKKKIKTKIKKKFNFIALLCLLPAAIQKPIFNDFPTKVLTIEMLSRTIIFIDYIFLLTKNLIL